MALVLNFHTLIYYSGSKFYDTLCSNGIPDLLVICISHKKVTLDSKKLLCNYTYVQNSEHGKIDRKID